MSHPVQRRGARALGAAAILMLAVGGPATARPDEAGGSQSRAGSNGQTSQQQNECHYLNQCEGTGSGPNSTTVLRLDDNAVEYLQLGAGVLAGIGLGGAGMAAASRRGHGRAAHPA